MLRLEAMTIGEFEAFAKISIDDYVEESKLAGINAAALSPAQAARIFRDLLPHGLTTPDHYLYSLFADGIQQPVGILWFADTEEETGQRTAFLYDIYIHPPYQRRGYASMAMRLLEQKSRELGLRSIGLNVFSKNLAAQALYTKMGFMPTELTMIKPL
ncbi:MAG: hypothetical protein NVSMB28_28530 [Collimonas sp.]